MCCQDVAETASRASLLPLTFASAVVASADEVGCLRFRWNQADNFDVVANLCTLVDEHWESASLEPRRSAGAPWHCFCAQTFHFFGLAALSRFWMLSASSVGPAPSLQLFAGRSAESFCWAPALLGCFVAPVGQISMCIDASAARFWFAISCDQRQGAFVGRILESTRFCSTDGVLCARDHALSSLGVLEDEEGNEDLLGIEVAVLKSSEHTRCTKCVTGFPMWPPTWATPWSRGFLHHHISHGSSSV